MGVPAFFWWLIKKYPSVLIDCKENKETGGNIYEDAILPNPNNVEFDNFYVDLNGIINPCIHPKNKPPPQNEEEMIIAIYDCLDRIFCIARPRKLLYLAIDGVAPKAKMNRQRSEHSKIAQEIINRNFQMERMREDLIIRGCITPPEQEEIESFDLNCIAPGTHFMDRLSKGLHFYIHDRLNNNVAWSEIKVIFSDASVPGEGRHKIMDFIRKQRFQPDHDQNAQHIICGAHADLIMLSLATHEPNITIIREELQLSDPADLCDLCNHFDHDMKNCIGLTDPETSYESKFTPNDSEVKFIFLRLSYLRADLRKTLDMYNFELQYNFERALDDWIFLSLLVDNDFLPPLLCLQIREGAIDHLVDLYTKFVYNTGGYLTDSGEIVLERLELILADLGINEDQIFKKRYELKEKMKKLKCKTEENINMDEAPGEGSTSLEEPQTLTLDEEALSQKNLESSQNLPSMSEGDDIYVDADDEEDEVRLWEPDFKDRYYQTKFQTDPDNLCFRYTVALQYIRGLSWLLKYCYSGCPSWTWYYPYHHAPFASDFAILQGLSTDFEKGSKPLNPLEYLMSILPAACSYLAPRPWETLMYDPDSPLINIYPIDFGIDIERKNDACMVVALLPFVNENKLLKVLQPYYKQLNDEELRLNKQGENRLYLNTIHPKSKFLINLGKILDYNKEVSFLVDGILGTILTSEENISIYGSLESPFPECPKITCNETITVLFRDPKYPEDFKFPSVRLAKSDDPQCSLILDTRKKQYHNAAKGLKTISSQENPFPVGLSYHKNGEQQYSPRTPLSNLSHQQQQQQQVDSTDGQDVETNPPQHPQKPQHHQQSQFSNAYCSGPGFQKNTNSQINMNNPNRRDGNGGTLTQDSRYQRRGHNQNENDPNQEQQQQQQQHKKIVNPFSNGGQKGYQANVNNHSQDH